MQTMRTALDARWRRIPANTRGALLVAVGALILICMAALVKYLGRTLPIFEILFVRCLAGLLFHAAAARPHGHEAGAHPEAGAAFRARHG